MFVRWLLFVLLVASARVVLGQMRPPPLHLEALTFDEGRGRLVLMGGVAFDSGRPLGYFGGTWEWDGTRWAMVVDSLGSPSVRHAHAIAYDREQRQVMLFGGAVDDTARCDTWSFDGTKWNRLNDSPCVTNRSAGASLVYHDRLRSMLLVDGPPSPPRDLTLRPLRLWRWSSNQWVLADSSGPRQGVSRVAYDEKRSVLVVPVFTGPDSGVWEWSRGGWKRAAATGPVARDRFGLVYDARTERVVLVGGLGPGRVFLDDAWTWDGSTWSRLSPDHARTPSARASATLLNDPRTGTLLYFGGTAKEGVSQDLWLLNRQGWRLWSP
jgi:hypothetical protein